MSLIVWSLIGHWKKFVENLLNHPYCKALVKVAVVVLFYFICSVFYSRVEGWDFVECIYFITVTIATVGYGYFHPTNNISRIFTIFVIIFGLLFIFSIISDFIEYVLECAEKQAATITKSDSVDISDPYKYVKKRLYAVGSVFLLVLGGSFFFWQNEGWSFLEAIYWCICTTSTVGYGDLTIQYKSSRIFLIFYIPVSVCIVAVAIGNFATISLEKAAEKKKLEFLRRKLDFTMIKEMDKDGDGVDRCEFLIAMLVQMGVCDKEKDIDPWLKRFSELDIDGSGKLDTDDIKILEQEEEARVMRINENLKSPKNTDQNIKTDDSLLLTSTLTENLLRSSSSSQYSTC